MRCNERDTERSKRKTSGPASIRARILRDDHLIAIERPNQPAGSSISLCDSPEHRPPCPSSENDHARSFPRHPRVPFRTPSEHPENAVFHGIPDHLDF